MTTVPLSKTKIETKLALIRESLTELEKLRSLSQSEFLEVNINFITAEHFLRRALEAIFDIAGHIVSRFPYSPGKRPITYKEIAVVLGEKGVVDNKFATESLLKMAGYRNRLVHHYSEVTKEELHNIIQNNVGDIDTFAKSIVNIIENPQNVGLEISEL